MGSFLRFSKLEDALFTDGMGWGGWTEYQKCPSILFILCRYLEHVYMKIVNNHDQQCYGFKNLKSC